ncbi:extra-cytoplasmic solute receptor [Rhodococcus sp. SRB_17]|nr:extra-cytoplasmic solute receptor [Rhodococcus sp. SRB_17]
MPNLSRRQFTKVLAGAGAAVFSGGHAWAQNNALMRIVVPFAPGGGGDVLGRIFAEKMATEMRRTIIVENKPGGSTTIGTDFVAKAKPDGNTILLTIPLLLQTYYLFNKLPYDPFNDIKPVVDLVKSPLWIAVSTQKTSANNFTELVREVKANPKTHIYGSIGNGSTSHILGNQLNKVSNLDMLHVPYKGSAQVSMALASGEITMTILDLVTLNALIPTGKIKLIAVTGTERSPLTPSIPTLAEQGYSGFELPTWAGFFVPKNTPPEIIQNIREVSIKIMNLPEIQSRFKDLGYVAGGKSTADFQKQLSEENARWGRLIKDSGIEI